MNLTKDQIDILHHIINVISSYKYNISIRYNYDAAMSEIHDLLSEVISLEWETLNNIEEILRKEIMSKENESN